MRALAVFFVCSCTVSVDLEGKACADAGAACLPGYACVAGLCVRGAVGEDAGCPAEPDPAGSQCAGHTYYLSASGTDAEDGGTPATARRTLTGVTLQPGDVVHLLGGRYAQSPRLAVSGTRQCPVLVRGEPDAGTVLNQPLDLGTSHTVVRWLTFSASSTAGVTVGAVNRVTFQNVTFAGSAPYAVRFDDDCSDCTLRDSTFTLPDGVALSGGNGNTPRLSLRNNRFALRHGEGFVLRGPGIVVSGNDFTGEYSLNFGVLQADPGTLVTRNVFHDVTAYFGDKVMLVGGRLTHNTFARIRDNTVPLVQGAERFDSNLVLETDHVVDVATGGYNVFDPTVDAPYADGGLPATDQVAPVLFDGLAFVPATGSAAIDSADPADSVPQGGGARADVGAVERGATGACLPDGGAL